MEALLGTFLYYMQYMLLPYSMKYVFAEFESLLLVVFSVTFDSVMSYLKACFIIEPNFDDDLVRTVKVTSETPNFLSGFFSANGLNITNEDARFRKSFSDYKDQKDCFAQLISKPFPRNGSRKAFVVNHSRTYPVTLLAPPSIQHNTFYLLKGWITLVRIGPNWRLCVFSVIYVWSMRYIKRLPLHSQWSSLFSSLPSPPWTLNQCQPFWRRRRRRRRRQHNTNRTVCHLFTASLAF